MTVPHVGGHPAKFVCLCVVAPLRDESPCRVCAATEPEELVRRMQRWHWVPLAIFERWWVPAYGDQHLGIARRVENEVKRVLGISRIRGGWYAVAVQKAAAAVQEAAQRQRVPLLPHSDYEQLLPSRSQMDDILLRRHRMLRAQ